MKGARVKNNVNLINIYLLTLAFNNILIVIKERILGEKNKKVF